MQPALPLAAPILAAGLIQEERVKERSKVLPAVQTAPSVKSAFGVGVIEVVYDARDLHTLVFVERVLEDAPGRWIGVEHQILAHFAAAVGQAVPEARRRGHQQQARRFGPVAGKHDSACLLVLFPAFPIEVAHTGYTSLGI